MCKRFDRLASKLYNYIILMGIVLDTGMSSLCGEQYLLRILPECMYLIDEYDIPIYY